VHAGSGTGRSAWAAVLSAIAIALLLWSVGGSAEAGSAAPAAPPPALDYHVREQPLADAVRAMGSLAGAAVEVDPGVDVVLRDRAFRGTLGEILAALGKEYGLFVYSDGASFHVDRRDVAERRLVKLGATSAEDALRLICAALPLIPQGAVELRPDIELVVLRGPPDFVKAAEEALKDPPVREVDVIGFGRLRNQVPAASLRPGEGWGSGEGAR